MISGKNRAAEANSPVGSAFVREAGPAIVVVFRVGFTGSVRPVRNPVRFDASASRCGRASTPPPLTAPQIGLCRRFSTTVPQ